MLFGAVIVVVLLAWHGQPLFAHCGYSKASRRMSEFKSESRLSVVFASRTAGKCRERALVLQALDISHFVFELEGRYVLAVRPEQAAEASEQIGLYESENRGWPPQLAQLPRVSNGAIGIMLYATILVLVFLMDNAGAFGQDWHLAGRIDGRLMRSGEWLRSVTALTLHGDIAHLAGNVVVGAVFGLFAGQLLGQGLGWWLILLAGASGNIVNVMLQHGSHRAVGASTAVFAALGLLTAYTWMHRNDRRFKLAYRIAPLISGGVLLAYLGTGDARTDIVAHLTGFAAGIGAGALASLRLAPWRDSLRAQRWLAIATVSLVAFAWLMQLGTATVVVPA